MLAMLISPGKALTVHAKLQIWQPMLKSLFFVFNIYFLRNYRIKYYDYIVKW